MEKNIAQLFDDNFDFAFRATTFNNMKVALKSLEQFKKKNADFFSFDKTTTLFGYLRTYAVEKQFNDSAFTPKSNYCVTMKQVNKYNYKVLCIETKDFIVNLGCTAKENILLPSSTYKKEFAKANSDLSTQMRFQFDDNEIKIAESKKYAEIVYGFKNGEISHLNILLPSYDYKGIEYSINILDDIKIYDNYVHEEIVEESIVKLKNSISTKIKEII